MTDRKKILKAPLRVAMVILLIGIVSRIAQWPFAKELIMGGFAAIALLYSARFWKKGAKPFLAYVKLTFVLTTAVYGILTMLHIHFTLFFQLIMGSTFILWFVMDGTAYFMDEDRRSKNSMVQVWWNIAMVLGTLSIILGGIMKIMHWEFANLLLISGIGIVAAYIGKDLFAVRKLEEKDTGNEGFQL